MMRVQAARVGKYPQRGSAERFDLFTQRRPRLAKGVAVRSGAEHRHEARLEAFHLPQQLASPIGELIDR
jgi:hypothetical protein